MFYLNSLYMYACDREVRSRQRSCWHHLMHGTIGVKNLCLWHFLAGLPIHAAMPVLTCMHYYYIINIYYYIVLHNIKVSQIIWCLCPPSPTPNTTPYLAYVVFYSDSFGFILVID